MDNHIKTVLLIQHSHTDIGYTDLQERIIDRQIDNIRSVIRSFDNGENGDYRWVCETFYIVERFLREATDEEADRFFALVRQKKIGLSLNYLNFNDLVDGTALTRQIALFRSLLKSKNIRNLRTAMCADITGLSMGQRDALIDNQVEMMYMNVNATHSNPPFNKRHFPFFWENAEGKRILIWSGEHYNLGNALGFRHEKSTNGFFALFVGDQWKEDPVDNLHDNLETYLSRICEAGYPYDFLPVSVSGLFTDNAPHNPEIIHNMRAYAAKYPDGIQLKMVTLEELYETILQRVDVSALPVYRGDMADWWANGIGCVPVAVAHYQDARRLYHLLLDEAPDFCAKNGARLGEAEEYMLLFAEHTYGHSATASHPFSKDVRDLDFRNQAYASRAHEVMAHLYDRFVLEQGGVLKTFVSKGTIDVLQTRGKALPAPLGFELEADPSVSGMIITDAEGQPVPSQSTRTSRGLTTWFLDTRNQNRQTNHYVYADNEHGAEPLAESVITETGFENRWLKLSWETGKGFTSWFDKEANRELLSDADAAFMTPVYELSPIQHDPMADRGMLGENIRGTNFKAFIGRILQVTPLESGRLFTDLAFDLQLEGVIRCRELIRIWNPIPRVDVTLQLCKAPTEAIESLYMPLTLHLPGFQMWVRKGNKEAFRPGLDQLPQTAQDYLISDFGVVYRAPDADVAYGVYAPDTALLAFSPFEANVSKGCEPRAENAERAVRSWIMNNTWETNFTLDLSGFQEYRFSFVKLETDTPDRLCDALEKSCRKPLAIWKPVQPKSVLLAKGGLT